MQISRILKRLFTSEGGCYCMAFLWNYVLTHFFVIYFMTVSVLHSVVSYFKALSVICLEGLRTVTNKLCRGRWFTQPLRFVGNMFWRCELSWTASRSGIMANFGITGLERSNSRVELECVKVVWKVTDRCMLQPGIGFVKICVSLRIIASCVRVGQDSVKWYC